MTRLQFLLVILAITIGFAFVSSMSLGSSTPEEQVRDTLHAYVAAYNSRDFVKYCNLKYFKDLPSQPGTTKPDRQKCVRDSQSSNHPVDSNFMNSYFNRLGKAKVVIGGPTQAGVENSWSEVSIQPFDWQSFDQPGTTYMIRVAGSWYVARSLYYGDIPQPDGSYPPISQPQFSAS
jgi:hypothetical protein